MDRDLDHYLDAAKRRQEYDSDAQLAEALGVKRSSLSKWRIRANWPDDDTMCAVARLAGMNVRAGLLALNAWRSSGTAKKIYEDMRRSIEAANPPPLAQ